MFGSTAPHPLKSLPWSRVLLCLTVLLTSEFAWSQQDTRRTPGQQKPAIGMKAPTLHVLTFGPGDHPFTKFGHDALWVHDPSATASRRDLVFNYGTFRFDSPWLILDFLKGNLGYWLSVSSLRGTLASYRAANRAISAQELALPPDTARAIVKFLYENAKPENKYYRYDYYGDNCATRIRDVLDQHLEQRLALGSKEPADLTFREHTRRLTQGAPELFFAIDLILGPHVDRAVTQWEAMFLPSELESTLVRLSANASRPLVQRTRSLLTSSRPPEPSSAPNSWTWLLGGLALGSSFWALGAAHSRKWARIAYGMAVGSFSLVAGLLGLGLWVLCLYTDHSVTYWNQNVLLSPAWAIALPWSCVDSMKARPRHTRFALVLSVTIAGAAWVLWILQPFLPQHSEPQFGVFLPVWTGIALSCWNRSGGSLTVLWSRVVGAFVRK